MSRVSSIEKDRRLIEESLPLSEISLDTIIEVGFKGLEKGKRQEYLKVFKIKPMVRGPRIRNLHTWFARRPCSLSRMLTLSSVVSSETTKDVLFNALGVKGLSIVAHKYGSGLLFYAKPDKDLVEKIVNESMKKPPTEVTVLDPMAGGGSIPLESARLGFRTIAMEYNPVAYLVLKATVEFPAKYADSGLFEETLKASKDFIRRAREELGRYYGDDTEGYIFARGVRCPFCRGLIPVQGIEPEITKDSSFRKRFLKITYDRQKKTFSVETTDEPIRSITIARRGNYIMCPYCGKWFQLRGRTEGGATAFDKWFRDHALLMESIVESFTPITTEIEESVLNIHIPLVKQVSNGFQPIWDDEVERGKFLDSLYTLSNEFLDLQDYIPLDEIPSENKWARTARSKGLIRWYMLFNPRQLLSIAKLTKFVAETAESLTSKNGEFGAAVATYLALALDKVAGYNTIATMWDKSQTSISHMLRGESTLDFRKEYTEAIVPRRNIEWALEPDVAESQALIKTAGGVLPVLRFLCDEFKDGDAKGLVRIYMGDATRLSSILEPKSVDVINVDPPYFEQVIYSDRSEFFWVILRRALAPVLELLFSQNLKLTGWTWTKPTVPRDREVVAYDKEDKEGRFSKLFKDFIAETSKVLRDDGVLVLWFTHPTAQAWRVVSESLYESGYVVPKVWPVQTEMKTRYKRHVNVVAQEMSLIIVGRKYPRQKLLEVSPHNVRESIMENSLFRETVERVVEDTREVIAGVSASPADRAALMFGAALSVASRFELPVGAKFTDLYDAAITAVMSKYIEPLIHKVLIETGPVKLDESAARRVVEKVAQAMLWDPATRSYLTLWLISRLDLATGEIYKEPLGLYFDLVQTVGKLCGFGIEKLKEYGLIAEKAVREGEKAYYPQFLEMLSLPGGRTHLYRLMQVTPGRAVVLAQMSMTESGDPALRAKSVKARMSEYGKYDDRELSRYASLAIVLLETVRDQDLGYRVADGTKLTKYIPGMDESEIAKVVRELAIKTLTHLVF
ncbi:MAG: hypothetical protein QXX84_07115 [Sulfolobales archaeon]